MKYSFAPLEPDAVAYLSEKTGGDFSRGVFTDPRWLCVTARDEDGTVRGVVVGELKQPWHCYMSLAIEDPRCWANTKATMAIFTAIFSRARRITVTVPTDKERWTGQLKALGFVYEGFMRRGFDGTKDALIFGMLPEDCLWLERARQRHARRHRSTGVEQHGHA
jgi:hypothetical protein